MKNRIKYLFVLSSLFILLMCSSVFADTVSWDGGSISSSDAIAYYISSTHYITAVTFGDSTVSTSLNKSWTTLTLSDGLYPEFSYLSGTTLKYITYGPTTLGANGNGGGYGSSKLYAYLYSQLPSRPEPEEFDPYAPSTVEGLEEFGFVYNWGVNSKIVNSYSAPIPETSTFRVPNKSPLDFGMYQSGVRQENISWVKSDQNNQRLGGIGIDDYEKIFVEFCYRGVSSVTISANNVTSDNPSTILTGSSSVLLPRTNDEFPFLPYGESSTELHKNFYYPDSSSSDGIYFSAARINRAILNYQNYRLHDSVDSIYNYPIAVDFNGTVSGNDTLFDGFKQYFSNDFYIGARFVGLKDGHWIYGPYKYDYFYITGNNLNLVPDNPENTIKDVPTKTIYEIPTSSPDVFDIVEKEKQPSNIYYNNEPTFTFSPSLPDDNSNNYSGSDANITINNINGNLVNEDLLNDNTLDTNKLQKWTSELVESVKNVPLALKDLFLFFPNWVLNLFVVSFGLLIIFRLLK